MDPFIGEIRPAGFNFAPNGWALCQGQIMSIAQNTALFSLLGTNYGGDGRVTFGLPNLMGNVALSSGQGPGLSNYILGEMSGDETVLLNTNMLASHSHLMACSTANGTQASPVGHFPASLFSASLSKGVYSPTANGNMEPSTVVPDGGGQPHNNMQPYLSINYIIALQGIFPSRS